MEPPDVRFHVVHVEAKLGTAIESRHIEPCHAPVCARVDELRPSVCRA